MITVTPIENKTRKEALLASTNSLFHSGNVLVIKDGGQELGYIVIDIDHSVLRLQSLYLEHGTLETLDAQAALYVDFLMRSAASYGANHGAFRVENTIAPLHDFFITKGFSMEHGVCSIPIHRIVHIRKPNCK